MNRYVSMNSIQMWILKEYKNSCRSSSLMRFNELDPNVDTESAMALRGKPQRCQVSMNSIQMWILKGRLCLGNTAGPNQFQ